MAVRLRARVAPLLLFAHSTLALAGCATLPAARPSLSPLVRLVGKVPSRRRFRLVGTVVGVAPAEGFVEAAYDARADLERRAVKIGATRVKIDELRIASEAAQRRYSTLMLVGRAYAPK